MNCFRRPFPALASRLLEYPDEDYFAALPDIGMEAEVILSDREEVGCLLNFIDCMQGLGQHTAREQYVSVFDHVPASSLHLSWHRYGNDKSQGRAMVALNNLYRAAGFEPLPGILPDYLPRMLEFLAIAEDWACEAMLDGFGAEMANLEKQLHELNICQAPLLTMTLKPFRQIWPEYFQPRRKDAAAAGFMPAMKVKNSF